MFQQQASCDSGIYRKMLGYAHIRGQPEVGIYFATHARSDIPMWLSVPLGIISTIIGFLPDSLCRSSSVTGWYPSAVDAYRFIFSGSGSRLCAAVFGMYYLLFFINEIRKGDHTCKVGSDSKRREKLRIKTQRALWSGEGKNMKAHEQKKIQWNGWKDKMKIRWGAHLKIQESNFWKMSACWMYLESTAGKRQRVRLFYWQMRKCWCQLLKSSCSSGLPYASFHPYKNMEIKEARVRWKIAPTPN